MRRLIFVLTLVIPVAIAGFSAVIAAEEKHGGSSESAGQPTGEVLGHEKTAHEVHPQEGPITAKPADQDLALWSLITFLVFVAVLKKFAWGPLIVGLNSRESQIKRDIADAESARVQAEKMLVQHQEKLERVQEEVKAILAEARRDADHTKAEIVAVAQKEAEASRHRAVLEIERAKEQALDELFAHMTKNVWTATEQVIGRTLTAGDHERLITEAVTSLSAQKN